MIEIHVDIAIYFDVIRVLLSCFFPVLIFFLSIKFNQIQPMPYIYRWIQILAPLVLAIDVFYSSKFVYFIPCQEMQSDDNVSNRISQY